MKFNVKKMNRKNLFKRLVLSVFIIGASANGLSAQDITALRESDYTIPSWVSLKAAYNKLQSARQPYSISMVYNGDPATRMGFSWFTNLTDVRGEVRIVEKADAAAEDFSNAGTMVFKADVTDARLNYYSKKNGEEIGKTGIQIGDKKDYTAHKAVATGLKPATTYSFRVGSDGGWSEIGTFTTAKEGKNDFSFVYITDTQANTAEMFDISQKTVHRALNTVPGASFLLCNGDFVESSGKENSEWEWEQWFSTMQDCWLTMPIVPVQGNHDTSPNNNFSLHFNTDTTYNDMPGVVPTAMDGTVYSFVYGDALFLVVNYEDWKKEGYFSSLAEWMRKEVEKHPGTRWRIATYHKCMFTGSRSHQSDKDQVALREAMLPVFDELKIDLALQGHDHVYEVIGPVVNTSKTLVGDAIEEQIDMAGGVRENMTGKQGGVYNVANGTLYFLNNSAGRKKYEPRDEEEMTAEEPVHLVQDYWGLFSGKFGQTGEPTFSSVAVTNDAIDIVTYTVDGNGKESVFDSFKVVKKTNTGISGLAAGKVQIGVDDNKNIVVSGLSPDNVEIYDVAGVLCKKTGGVSLLDASSLPSGTYLVRVMAGGHTYTQKIIL